MMAYSTYKRIPDFSLPTNIRVMVAEQGPWQKVNPPAFEKANAQIRGWAAKTGGKVWIWTYPHKFRASAVPGLPQMTPHAWGEMRPLLQGLQPCGSIYGILWCMELKPLPIDSGDFVEIRTAKPQKLYVDKTAYFHRMITDPQARNFFLARPRRFGKSLMITTLKAIFQGQRKLFKGLAIDKLKYDWKKYPVIHLNLARCASAEYADFDDALPKIVGDALREAGYRAKSSDSAAVAFGRAIDYFAAKKKRCVILIDEYDDPVARALKDPVVADRVRGKLADLYGQLKDRTNKVRFLMITGVSKFTKMSVFSTISNLVDLGAKDAYASMLGYTDAELDKCFSRHMAAHRVLLGLDATAYRQELRRQFNGYRFWKHSGENVYNPVSINWNLADPQPEFLHCWTTTGRPSMLMNFMQRGDLISLDPECVSGVSETDFDVTDLAHLKAMPMLYQTGYLTIKDYNPISKSYELGVPDEEVRQDLSLLMTSQTAGEDVAWASSLGKKLLNFDFDGFFDGLAALYAAAPYGSTEKRVHESSYSRNLLFLLRGQGIICQPEVQQSDGRADLVADHPCGTYIFELKVGRSAKLASTQAQRKRYAAPYAAAGKPVWVIGLAFAKRSRRLVDHCVTRFR